MKPIHVPMVVAVALFVAVLPDLPYSYFQLLRWLVCIVCCYGALAATEKRRQGWIWMMVGMAIVFNPVLPIRFNRDTWRVLDPIAAVIFLIAIPIFKKTSPSS